VSAKKQNGDKGLQNSVFVTVDCDHAAFASRASGHAFANF
jgi:hypothetical protein